MSVKLVVTATSGHQQISWPENLDRAITIAHTKMTRHARGIREIKIMVNGGKKPVKRWRAYIQWREVGS